MNFDLAFDGFVSQARSFIDRALAPSSDGHCAAEFNRLSLDLFALQFQAVPIYRDFCEARRVFPGAIARWNEIPALPASAFKDYDVTSLRDADRTRVFFSSGTTGQPPSRHYHDAQSLELYEASLWPWFDRHLTGDRENLELVFLAPSPSDAPHSSLVHMFDTIKRRCGRGAFFATVAPDGSWTIDHEKAGRALNECARSGCRVALLGPAFSFAHLLDGLARAKTRFNLPNGSRVMETGGYKGRSRVLRKDELHQWISAGLGIRRNHVVTEYGMSELSAQAYDGVVGSGQLGSPQRRFKFPPWAREEIISTETGEAVGEGETGLLRIFDLANARSVMALQTSDLAIRRADRFELIGRAASAEPRGCSLALQET